jgi:SpoVK/Ycf46/Vps4 family AAA+-type ATPase
MRKGADVLSKWVGEAERQLRLLFEEAKNCQPSIIFFDEIDGLAPVRSSKQDQIHASIVSTLLALMDGMDGRGQVVVIGATNRPDAVDPALRRPGRFDREFYFPLPNLAARDKILGIMTRKWDGWDDDRGAENVKGLAKLTKGYGGADLRVCLLRCFVWVEVGWLMVHGTGTVYRGRAQCGPAAVPADLQVERTAAAQT